MRVVFILFICCSLIAQLDAQGSRNSKKRNFRAFVEEAETYINQRKYLQARRSLEQCLRLKEKYALAHRLLGLVCLKLRDYENATMHYTTLFESQEDLSLAAYYECAIAYMNQYKYEDALRFLLVYENADPDDFNADEQTVMRSYDMYLQRNKQNCRYARQVVSSKPVELAKNLGKKINTSADEYLPALSGDGQWLIFTSNYYDENIYYSKRNSINSDWSSFKSIGNAINTPRNEAMAKISTSGHKIYFSACGWENVKGGCDLFEADFDTDNDFGVIDKVEPITLLNGEKWESQPALSCDGTMIFFASNREGGLGGSDIWMSTKDIKGKWGPAINLGDQINTPGDEEAPYLALDGQTLLFSSDGHPGFGEADIFKTYSEDYTSWSKPINLGPTINSPHRETGITLSSNKKELLFSSSRDGTLGGLDLYQLTLDTLFPLRMNAMMLDLRVYNAVNREPIKNVALQIGSTGYEKMNVQTDEKGRAFLCLRANKTFSYILKKKGFETFIGADYLNVEDAFARKKIEIFMNPGQSSTFSSTNNSYNRLRKNLSLYYPSGGSTLSDEQKRQIKKMVQQYDRLDEKTFKVVGYADNTGDTGFNENLSGIRAKAVADYLVSLGVNASNVIFTGKGILEGELAKHQKRRVEISVGN